MKINLFTNLLFLKLLNFTAANDSEDARDKLFIDDIVKMSGIKVTNNSFVHMAFIATFDPADKTSAFRNKILNNLDEMITSLLRYSGSTPLHLIVITDLQSKDDIQQTMKNSLGKFISQSLIWQKDLKKVPKLCVEFVNLQSLTSKYRHEIGNE